MKLLGLAAMSIVLSADALDLRPMHVENGIANALFFVTDECPLSNGYAHEIARICSDYKPRGINCALLYVNPALSDEQARKHAQEYGHGDYPRIVDRRHEVVKASGVTITPEVAVVDKAGKIVYRGRIDDSYASLAQPRRPVRSADLRNALDDVVAGKPVERSETKALGCYISDLAVDGNVKTSR